MKKTTYICSIYFFYMYQYLHTLNLAMRNNKDLKQSLKNYLEIELYN